MPITYDVRSDILFLEGRVEGRQEGKEEGENLKERQFVLRLKAKGFSMDDIVELSGIPLARVAEIIAGEE